MEHEHSLYEVVQVGRTELPDSPQQLLGRQRYLHVATRHMSTSSTPLKAMSLRTTSLRLQMIIDCIFLVGPYFSECSRGRGEPTRHECYFAFRIRARQLD